MRLFEIEASRLYHFTDLGKLKSILEQDQLGQQGLPVSLTRDRRHFWYANYAVMLTLDRGRLANQYRLTPHVGDFSQGEEQSWLSREAEERLDRPIRPLSRYCDGIQIDLSRLVYDDALAQTPLEPLVDEVSKLAAQRGIDLKTTGKLS